MTRFLNLDLLRAHEVPEMFSFVAGRDQESRRPRLVAQWECASDGRLVCRWRTDDEPSG